MIGGPDTQAQIQKVRDDFEEFERYVREELSKYDEPKPESRLHRAIMFFSRRAKK